MPKRKKDHFMRSVTLVDAHPPKAISEASELIAGTGDVACVRRSARQQQLGIRDDSVRMTDHRVGHLHPTRYPTWRRLPTQRMDDLFRSRNVSSTHGEGMGCGESASLLLLLLLLLLVFINRAIPIAAGKIPSESFVGSLNR
ncbi:hypothetical protein B296_00027193 [Ensete ventricosum]|uniref:Uncharacterized protein n=1 Tax=Ensete ventricosum TaxID=4639 RepID=A0A426XKH6_ENSVE|nr:hypothetical protein B296_00027193 [Ensete ventricosum]